MSEYHTSVLLDESVSALVDSPDGVYADATFGGGGHKVAAGATISGDYETVKKEVLNKILEVYFS